MDASTAIVGGIWLAILIYGGYFLYVWARSRISPKYAAQRKLRLKEKSDRAFEARRKRRAARDEHLQTWAEENSEDPVAKALLAEKSSPSLPTLSPRKEEDLQATLRRRQEEADDTARRIAARKAEKELENQRLLEWAKANPSTPEGKRHLVEALVEADKTAEDADRDIRIAGYFSSGEENNPESIMTATRIADAEARKAAAQRVIEEIQAALAATSDQ